MATPVDEVFGGGGGGPVLPQPTAPTAQLRNMLLIGWVLVMAGPCCFTGVPGGALAIWVWTRADETMVLVENGTLPPSEGAPIRRLRTAAFGVMGIAVVLTMAQLTMFGLGVYDALLEQVILLLDQAGV